ncbi:hypothetical protein PPL_09520 [Heterostelium album PN500]|uniref:AB hydrolase-1 domain-containing protein n=1 Tax=Heterostelium pallidum (strain ATCC 26659 / Pp 5 / PN500) TaxID=670386 RepID=D3BNA9_HETP5|nr:hypothetical protein PPL_09520 [Heterostelium album PN500]EFA76769.1 hypothetical protein PPL_09520 [Heterostelium album PN500]|eukprot:XP_020428901.1 hypothetical protein PPL_09520 [Heterostelium album PN500]
MKSPINLYFNKENTENLKILEKCPTLYRKPKVDAINSKSNDNNTTASSDEPSVVNDATFETSLLLANTHFHSYYASYHRNPLNLPTRREVLIAEDGGTVSLDWFTFDNDKNFNEETPTILMLHGLTGGSHEVYVQYCAKDAYTKKGFRTVVFNYRGCAENIVTADQTYSAAFTGDLKMVVKHLVKTLPKAKLFAIGFSLGSAILAKYLSQVGTDTPFIANCSASNPMDMNKSSINLKSTYINNKFYNEMLANNLKNLFTKWGDRLEQFAKREDVLKAMTIKEIDELITSKVFGYASAEDYYKDGSACNHLEKIEKPILFLTSTDDPIAPTCGIPFDKFKANPNTILATTSYGGHLGFLYDLTSNQSWLDNVVVEYFSIVADFIF